jgi:hypothetical protein
MPSRFWCTTAEHRIRTAEPARQSSCQRVAIGKDDGMTVNPGFGGQKFLPEMLPTARNVQMTSAVAGSFACARQRGRVL